MTVFEESTFFTGNGRMGIRGYLPFWQEKRTFETGLFVAGIFGEIKPGITDFVNLPTPVWGNIECDGHPITLSSPGIQHAGYENRRSLTVFFSQKR